MQPHINTSVKSQKDGKIEKEGDPDLNTSYEFSICVKLDKWLSSLASFSSTLNWH